MRIAYVLGQFPSYTETFISNEIDELRRAGLRIDILSLNKNPSAPSSPSEVIYDCSFFEYRKIFAHFLIIKRFKLLYFLVLIEVIRKSGFSLRKIFKNVKNFSSSVFLIEQIKYQEIGHIHAHFMSTPSSIAIILSKFLKIPFSCTGHANDIYTSSRKELIEKITYSKFVVTCTLFNKAYLSKLTVDKSKIIHVYHGIHLSKWIRKKTLCVLKNKKTINLLLVGRLVAKKGIIYLLEAIILLQNSKYNVKCIIIGDGPEYNSLTSFIHKNDLAEIVYLLPSMPQGQLQEFYQEADIFVLPSLIALDGDRDGLPNVLLEAMAVGVPIITTAISAIGELIEDQQTGLLIPPRNSAAIVEAIVRMIEDQDLYLHLFEVGEQRIKKFDIQESTKALFKIFNEN